MLWLDYISLRSCIVYLSSFVYLFLDMLGLHCSGGFSLVWYIDSSWGLFSLQSMGSRVLRPQWLRYLASVVAVPRLWSTGSIVEAHRLSCSTARGIFLDQGSNQCLLHWQVDSLPLSRWGRPYFSYFRALSCVAAIDY